jgi:hypothetical protein
VFLPHDYDFLIQLLNYNFFNLEDLITEGYPPCFVFVVEMKRKRRVMYMCDILKELLPFNILIHVLSPLINYE